MLYSSQKKIIQEIKDKSSSNHSNIAIIGKVNSGKSFAIKEYLKGLDDSATKTLVFNRSEENDELYAPFEKASRKSITRIGDSFNKLLVDNRDKDYSIPQAIISLLDHLKYQKNRKNQSPYFLKVEEQFLSMINNKIIREVSLDCIKKLQNGGEKLLIHNIKKHKKILAESLNNINCIFFFEEINTWDNNSLLLAKKMFEHDSTEYPLIHKAKIIYTMSDNDDIPEFEKKQKYIEDILKKSDAVCLKMAELSGEDYETFIEEKKLELSIEQKSEIIETLKVYSQENIEEIPDMIEEIHQIIKEESDIDNQKKSKFYNSLKKKLDYNNISLDKSEEILEYAALMGRTFTKNEIAIITELNNDQFRLIIERVINIKVIKEVSMETKDTYKFACSFFKEIFKNKALIKRDEYYHRLERVINQLYPYRYDKRAHYLELTENSNKFTQELYLLSLLSQLRQRQGVDDLIKSKLDEWSLDCFNLFFSAYRYIRKNHYREAIVELNLIKSKYADLSKQVEADMLLALCYSKTISSQERIASLGLLERYIDNDELKDNFADIYERLLMRLFVMYTHTNNLKKAKKTYNKLLNILNKYDGNIDAKVKTNTLYRVSNTIYDENMSKKLMKDATEYFENMQSHSNGLVDYYISLCNYSGVQIMNGEFKNAYKTTQLAEILTVEHKNIEFPRPQILLNNYLLSGYLSNQLNIKDVITVFEKIILEMVTNAERLFFTSNLSIFYSMNGEYEKAYKVLSDENELQNASDDVEGKYNARVKFNLSVYNFLLGEKETAISEMKEYYDSLLFSQDNEGELVRTKEILDTMETLTDKIDGRRWLEVLLADQIVGELVNSDTNTNSSHYKKLGYMFTSLYNWDI